MSGGRSPTRPRSTQTRSSTVLHTNVSTSSTYPNCSKSGNRLRQHTRKTSQRINQNRQPPSWPHLWGPSLAIKKKTMMGAAGRQQHVFRCLGNQICDNPPRQHPHFLYRLKLSQVWKPAPTAHTQDLSTHQSISSTTVLAPLVGAITGNIKKR